MRKRVRKLKVPDVSEWSGYRDDLDVRDLHRMFFGKTNEEVQEYFGGTQSISRMDELLYAPRDVFQYYVFAFDIFLRSEIAKEDSDSASALLEAREKRDPGSVSKVLAPISPLLEFVAERQSFFDADVNIYGSFPDRVRRIVEQCG